MPKSIVIEPERVFARETHPLLRRFRSTRTTRPSSRSSREYSRRGPAAHLAGHVRDPRVRDRSQEIKTKGAYKGVTYNHAGPAHLSIGQEAAAVGMAFSLDARRPHLRLASQPRRDPRQGLLRDPPARATTSCWRSCRSYRDGALLRPVERGYSGYGQGPGASASSSTAPTARSSRARPASTAGWAARCTRSSRRSGSTRTTRSSAARARSRLARRSSSASTASPASSSPTSATASFGCGPVWEGITFSAMDQYRTLWDPSLGGGLPIIFNCMNNFYGMGGQPFGETMGVQLDRARRRRRQPRADARRARQRLRPAARHRRLPAQEARSCAKAAARCCSRRSPIASAATRRPTPRATARRKRSSAGSRRIRSAPSAPS